jgi:CheY-like chemotaxis protein
MVNGMSLDVTITNAPHRISAVVIDADPVAQNVLASCLAAMEWEVRVASDGHQGLALLHERPSSVVFSEWSLPGLSGLEVCSHIRQRVWAERPYVILTTGKDPHDLWRAIAAGADDVLRKPFERREVETRGALARYFTEGNARLSLDEAVTEAMDAAAGEIVMRQGEVLARVMFRGGHIVWVTLTPAIRRFADHLARELGLDEEQIREVLQESKSTGVPFDKLIVDWKLAPREALHDCLRGWILHMLARVREMSSPSVMFVPLPPGGLTFEGFAVEDIAPWMMPRHESRRDSNAPLSARSDGLAQKARHAMQIDGAAAAFVLAVRDGTCLAQSGDGSHIEVSWALARALHAMPNGSSSTADILLTSPSGYYVARHLERDPEMLMVVVIKHGATTSGAARLLLARLASAGGAA